jgi:hypothetical protein
MDHAPLFLSSTSLLFAVIMLGSLLIMHLRALYTRGLSAEALAR